MTAVIQRRTLTEGTTRRGVEVYRVTDASTIAAAVTDSDLPAVRAAFPGVPTLRAREFEADYLEGSKGDAWDVTVRYEPITAIDPDIGGPDDPGDPGFTEINVDQEAQPYDAWRVAGTWEVAPDAASTSGTDLDIGGDKIDSAGEPVSIVRVLPTVRISVTIGTEPDYATIRSLAGRRNSVAYLGAPFGTLLYRGANSRRVGLNKYVVDHTFHYDDWHHLVQVPFLDENGIATKVVHGTGDTLRWHASKVMWHQPFRLLGSFASLDLSI